MTVSQILYDINFLQSIIPGYENCIAWHVLDYLGGLSFSIWSNILSFVVLYIVVKIRSLDIFNNYRIFLAIAVVPSLAIALMAIPVLNVTSDDDHYCAFDNSPLAIFVQEFYYWGRIVTIIFNCGVFLFTSHRVQLMMQSVKVDDKAVIVPIQSPLSTNLHSSSRTRKVNSGTVITQNAAIIVLVSRMKYYPLAQAISRSGSAWNEFNDNHDSTFASGLMSAICAPSVGILNFIIFLVSQSAQHHIYALASME
jgi:hypothetical protein